MKTLLILPVAALMILSCLISSCNKEDESFSGTPIKQVQKSTAVFEVTPSGNYTDDADAIQLALTNAVTAGPGSTVQLTAGTFYLDTRIEIDGFDGYFVGAGKENTIITTHGQVDLTLTNDDVPALIKFRHGNVNMSDMTIKITVAEPVTGVPNNEWFQNAIPYMLMVTGNSSDDPITEDEIGGATFDNVNFIGGQGNLFGLYNVSTFIIIGAEGWNEVYYTLNDGIYNFFDCEFKTAERGIVCFGVNSNDNWTIGGVANKSNLFDNLHFGVILMDFDDSYLDISHNEFTHIKRGGIMIAQGYYYMDLEPSTCLIHANELQIEDIADGIIIGDLSVGTGESKLLNVTVSNNDILMNDTEWGGIYAEGGEDVIISNNKIHGTGLLGIYAGVWGYLATDWTLIGNNVQQLNAYIPIYLGSGTSNFLVIGGSNQTNVLNSGTNNILTGVNNMQVGIGQELQAALELKHQIIMQSLHH